MNRFQHVATYLLAVLLIFGTAGCRRAAKEQARHDELINEISTTPMLYTVAASAQVIVTESDSPDSWKRLLGDRILLVPVQAKLKAGVDISKITQITFKGNVVHIVLPPPVIEIESTVVCNDDVASDVALLRSGFTEQEKALVARQGRNKIVRMLPKMDLVKPAQERAKQTLIGMAKSLGYTAQVETTDYSASQISQMVKK